MMFSLELIARFIGTAMFLVFLIGIGLILVAIVRGIDHLLNPIWPYVPMVLTVVMLTLSMLTLVTAAAKHYISGDYHHGRYESNPVVRHGGNVHLKASGMQD